MARGGGGMEVKGRSGQGEGGRKGEVRREKEGEE